MRALSGATLQLPSTCQVCGAWPSQPICPVCEARHAAVVPRCPMCAKPVPHAGQPCVECRSPVLGAKPDPLRTVVAAIDYGYPWDSLIARFKFRSEPGWAGPLAALMLRQPPAVDLMARCDVMVPIPVTTSRLAERGYNQAWELLKALRRQSPDRLTSVPLADALVRVGNAPDQHELTQAQRLKNLRGSFVVHPQRVEPLLNARVLLVDDVSTTGTTLRSAARALLQAGAQEVSALVLARTVHT